MQPQNQNCLAQIPRRDLAYLLQHLQPDLNQVPRKYRAFALVCSEQIAKHSFQLDDGSIGR